MEFIKQWFSALIAVLFLSQIATMMLPDGQIAKYVRLVVGLLIMLMVLKPIFALTHTQTNFYQNYFETGQWLDKNKRNKLDSQTEQIAVAKEFQNKLGVHIKAHVHSLSIPYDAKEVVVNIDDNPKSSGFLNIREIRMTMVEKTPSNGKIIVQTKQKPMKMSELDKTVIMDSLSRAYNIPKEHIIMN
ncbi:MAG: stage III sporulation protein AF [Hyphomonadaceae bacterium]|nr:stage III sporulation protein AF [Clostridia bacterium]